MSAVRLSAVLQDMPPVQLITFVIDSTPPSLSQGKQGSVATKSAEIKFLVPDCHVSFGETVRVVGDAAELGERAMLPCTACLSAAAGRFDDVIQSIFDAELHAHAGAWDAAKAPELTWEDGDRWTAALSLPSGEYLFKLVRGAGAESLTWEDGEDRKLKVRRGLVAPIGYAP